MSSYLQIGRFRRRDERGSQAQPFGSLWVYVHVGACGRGLVDGSAFAGGHVTSGS